MRQFSIKKNHKKMRQFSKKKNQEIRQFSIKKSSRNETIFYKIFLKK